MQPADQYLAPRLGLVMRQLQPLCYCCDVLQQAIGRLSKMSSRPGMHAGQTKPTRVVRLLTEGTIEKALLAYQRSKAGSAKQEAEQLQEQELLAGNTLATLLEAHP